MRIFNILKRRTYIDYPELMKNREEIMGIGRDKQERMRNRRQWDLNTS